MKKIVFLLLFAVTALFASAQSNTSKSKVNIAYGLDSLNNPQYGDIFLFGEETPFYIVVSDANPIVCNTLKVTAYFKDKINGKEENDYWVNQGTFDYEITPNYFGYWVKMNAHSVGDYKIEVSGYLNGSYQKYFGYSIFTVFSEDDFWSWGFW